MALTLPKSRANGRILWTPGLAYEVLAPTRQGWDMRKTPHTNNTRGRTPFELVPPKLRYLAAEKLHELVKRWMHDHPGQQMSQQKYASLHGNAVNWVLYQRTRKLVSQSCVRARQRHLARRYLASLQLAAFKAQPLAKRRKQLI